MAVFDEFEGGVAVAEAPAEEPEQAAETPEGIDVEVASDWEWEVETEPAEADPVETVTEETVVEEYYEPGYRRDYGGGGYYDRGYGQGYYQRGRAVRRWNKHMFTWVFSFIFGIYGVDRFMRGQIGLGLLKLLTFGGFGMWYLADVIIAALQSYVGPYRDSEDILFDAYGRYTY